VRRNQFVDRVIATPDAYKQTWAAARALRREFRAERPVCVLTTVGSSRSRVSLVALLGAGRALRAGYTQAAGLYDLPLATGKIRQQIGANLRVLELIGITARDVEPRLFFTESDVRKAMELRGEAARGTAILVAATSGGLRTGWMRERLAAVGRHLSEVCGMQVLLPGMAGDAAAMEAMAAEIGGGARSVAGRTSVGELAALCAASDLCVTLDTGTQHVARTQELPMVSVLPAWQPVEEWQPLGKPWAMQVVGAAIAAPAPAGYCMEELTVEMVTQAVGEMLRRYPPDEAARQARVRRSVVKD
jgi:ADP-heptose:LPS heptosyltransferase